MLYPTVENLRDYLSWRQVDCKTFWCLIYTLGFFEEGKKVGLMMMGLCRSYQQSLQYYFLGLAAEGGDERHRG